MSFVHVRDASQTDGLRRDLASSSRIALDCEAAGFHRYSDRLCLLQITTESDSYILDPLAFDPSELLRSVLEDPSIPVLMHGADYDLRLLDRDLGILLRGLFDTQVAAALLGEKALGLQALLESRLGVSLSKKYQRADWAERPLADGMLEYAADDTRYLFRLADVLAGELAAAGRTAWAEEECRFLEESATGRGDDDAEPEDPVTRVKGARDLTPREVTALREALEWRDRMARERDKAPFRVVGDQPLLEAVLRRPLDQRELAEIKGFPVGLARSEGSELLDRFDRVAQLPDEEIRPYPRSPRRGGPGRAAPDAEELAEKLKVARNKRADELGLDRGTLMANALVQAIAVQRPATLEALARLDGIRGWQVEAVGQVLLEVLDRRR
ncbi:MAG TPA: HRDC domain-containing protein [Longimicrobiales bacterium]|nr:HRDC domain-containing protein [Longimicrobiales bacterium]